MKTRQTHLILFIAVQLFYLLTAQQQLRTLKNDCTGDQIYDVENDLCISAGDCTKYLVDGKTCTLNCPSNYFAFDKVNGQQYTRCSSTCAKQSEESTLIAKKCYDQCPNGMEYYFNSQTYCFGCPKSAHYHTLQSQGKYKCSTQCDGGLVFNIQFQMCQQKTKCFDYVIDNIQCSKVCPQNYYLYPKDQNMRYQVCTSTCAFLGRDDNGDYYCQDQCTGTQFTAKDASGNNIIYCDTCPKNTPIKSVTSQKQFTCSKCPLDQIPDLKNNVCLQNKTECQGFVVNGVSCESCCNPQMFTFPAFKDYQRCELQCDEGNVIDPYRKKCYGSKSECPLTVSSEGKKCLDQCEGQNEIPVTANGFKQCKPCTQYIKSSKDNPRVSICASSCDEGQMAYVNGDFVVYKQCMPSTFCDNKKKSASNPNQCSQKCRQPEVDLNGICIPTSCPKPNKYSISDNSCVTDCNSGDFLSSDKTLCVQSCSKIFEVRDGNSNTCKQCNPNESFVLIDSKASCKANDKSDATSALIKQSLINVFGANSISTLAEIERALTNLTAFSKSIEADITEISGIQSKTDDDQAKARSKFQDLLDVQKAVLYNSLPSIVTKPIQTCNTQLKVISQVAQSGQRFKLSFDSDQIQKCSVSKLLEDDPDLFPTAFTPLILQVSFIKDNHFCTGNNCKNSPSLVTVSYDTSMSRRLLAAVTQEFTIEYNIPAGQDSKKQVCLNYDINGVVTRSEGEINGNLITCKFTSSSSLLYDATCMYVNKSLCESTTLLNEQENNDNGLSGGAIAGIVIGVIVAVGLICVLFYLFLRKEKEQEIKHAKKLQTLNLETDQCNLKVGNANMKDTENQLSTNN